MANARQRLGARGEARAAAWYVERGYEVVAQNWRVRDGEIDLVVARDGVVVVCEVKTRSSTAFGTGLDAITFAKQRRLRRLAAAFLQTHHDHRGALVRFDVVSIVGDQHANRGASEGEMLVVEGAF
jgi:putative endonuclease